MLTLTKKKLTCLIMLIFLILAFSHNSLAIVKPTKDFYVNDYANILTEETKQYIISANIDLEIKTKAQVVVVTVNSLEGKTIEEYATELFRRFGIGDKEKNNGVLLLCSKGDRMFRIEVGYGLEGVLTDGKTGRIQDEYIIPYLKNDNYDKGIKNGFSAVVEQVCNEYNVSLSGIEKPKSDGLQVMTQMIGPTIMVTGIITLLLKRKSIIIKLIYFCLLSVVSYSILRSIAYVFIVVIINMFFMLEVAFGGGSSRGRGSSGRGFSSGGGFSGGRRFFWRRRKLKAFLKAVNRCQCQ